jgi:hypothetical protein
MHGGDIFSGGLGPTPTALVLSHHADSKKIDLDGYVFILLLSCTFAETNLTSSSFFVKLKSSPCAYSIGADYHFLFYFLWIHSPLIATFVRGCLLSFVFLTIQ